MPVLELVVVLELLREPVIVLLEIAVPVPSREKLGVFETVVVIVEVLLPD